MMVDNLALFQFILEVLLQRTGAYPLNHILASTKKGRNHFRPSPNAMNHLFYFLQSQVEYATNIQTNFSCSFR